MSSTNEKIIKKFGQTEIAKKLQRMLEKIESVYPIIPDILLLTKTDENMKKIIKALEDGVTDRDEILYRAICIKQGKEYDPTFLEDLESANFV